MPTRRTLGAEAGAVVVAIGAAAAILLVAALAVLPVRVAGSIDVPAEFGLGAEPGPLGTLFRPRAGLTFATLPSEVVEEIRASVEAVQADPRFTGAVSALAGRSVMDDGSRVALVVALRLDDRLAAQPGFGPLFTAAAARAAGPRVDAVTVSGEAVLRAADANGRRMLLSYYRGTVILVGGSDDQDVLGEVMATILANAR